MEHMIAMQEFRATILSDGHLALHGKGARFQMGLSDNKDSHIQRERIPVEDLLKFLQRFVYEVLKPLKIEPLQGHPRVEPHIGKSKTTGEWLPGALLYTQSSGFLLELYHEYYPDGIKAIPENFILTDAFLAQFFMFDGTSRWTNGGGPAIDVFLYTQGFDLHSVELFESQLHSFGFETGRAYYTVEGGAGVAITVLQKSVDHFMGVIDLRVIPPYRYKVKYRGSCPPELAEEYRARNNERVREWRRKKKEGQALMSAEAIFTDLRKELRRAT